MASGVCILIKQRTGEEIVDGDNPAIPFQTYVQKGELVVEIPLKDRLPRKDGSPSHNFSLYRDHTVTLYDDGTGTSQLYGPEADYLEAIHSPTTRLVQYLEPGKMEWITELKMDDIVFFRIKLTEIKPSLLIKGMVRYYGLVKGHNGVMFGIQILVSALKL